MEILDPLIIPRQHWRGWPPASCPRCSRWPSCSSWPTAARSRRTPLPHIITWLLSSKQSWNSWCNIVFANFWLNWFIWWTFLFATRKPNCKSHMPDFHSKFNILMLIHPDVSVAALKVQSKLTVTYSKIETLYFSIKGFRLYYKIGY